MAVDRTEYDFSEFDENPSSARLPEGEYLMRVKAASHTKIKKGQNEGVGGTLLTFEVVEDGDYKGQIVVDRLWNLPNAMWRVANFFRAINIPFAKNKVAPPFSAYIGKTLTVAVKDGEPFKDTIKSEVAGYSVAQRKAPIENQNALATHDQAGIELTEPKVQGADADPWRLDQVEL